ncbi:hypothetical protein [Planomonospora algeriensis]
MRGLQLLEVSRTDLDEYRLHPHGAQQGVGQMHPVLRVGLAAKARLDADEAFRDCGQ